MINTSINQNIVERNIAIALWLVDNTKLNPEQIAKIAKIHLFEAILLHKKLCDFDYEPINPIKLNIISEEELSIGSATDETKNGAQKIQKRYIPKPLRKYIPGSLIWLTQQYPQINIKTVCLYLGITTKKAKEILEDQSLEPINPLLVQLVDQKMLDIMTKS